jgi:hypothetical protein
MALGVSLELINELTAMIGWRFVETHFLWITFRKSYADPALTKHAYLVLFSVTFAQFNSSLKRNRVNGQTNQSSKYRSLMLEFNFTLHYKRCQIKIVAGPVVFEPKGVRS